MIVATFRTAALIVARADSVRDLGTAAIEQRVAYERSLRHKRRSACSRNAFAAPTQIWGLVQLGARELDSQFYLFAVLADGAAFWSSGGLILRLFRRPTSSGTSTFTGTSIVSYKGITQAGCRSRGGAERRWADHSLTELRRGRGESPPRGILAAII